MGVDNNKSKFNVYYLTLQFFPLISWFIQNEYKFELKESLKIPKEEIRIPKLKKDRQRNGQKKKDKRTNVKLKIDKHEPTENRIFA